MLGPIHFSSTSATNARSLAYVDTLSSNRRAAWAFGGSSCNRQRHWRAPPRLSRFAGNIRRDFTFPYLAQTKSMAYLRLSSSWNGGKPFFSALVMSQPKSRGHVSVRTERATPCDKATRIPRIVCTVAHGSTAFPCRRSGAVRCGSGYVAVRASFRSSGKHLPIVTVVFGSAKGSPACAPLQTGPRSLPPSCSE